MEFFFGGGLFFQFSLTFVALFFFFHIDEALPKRYLLEMDIREYHPFQLMSVGLDSLVSTPLDRIVVVDGVNGNKFFLQLDFCIVSSDEECSPSAVSDCIYQSMDYRSV